VAVPPTESQLAGRLSSPRILVAEADPASAEFMQVYLEAKGYEVVVARDSKQALESFASAEFDLLILDVHIPLYGGAEVVQMLREPPLGHRIKIMALTADTRWTLREEMKRLGVDAYLIKPLSSSRLGTEVARLLDPPLPNRGVPRR